MLPAGGAPEIELCQQLQKYGRKETGLDQYAIAKFAESLEVRVAALRSFTDMQPLQQLYSISQQCTCYPDFAVSKTTFCAAQSTAAFNNLYVLTMACTVQVAAPDGQLKSWALSLTSSG